MKIITFSNRLSIASTYGPQGKSEVNANPGERLIFSEEAAQSIQSHPIGANNIYEITDLGPLLKELPTLRDWKRRRVLFYRNRGIGDQLICSALSRYAREILGAECYQLSERVHEPVWAFNAHIGGMPIAVPLHLDAVWKSKGRPFFDKCFFFESVTEWDSDSEQPNVYDRLFAMLGLDPTRVPAKYKRPVFNLQPDEVCKRIDWLKTASKIAGRDLSKGYIFFQLHATNLVRSLPLELIKTILSAVNEYADPLGISILCADDQPFSVEIQRLIAQVPSAINVAGAITNVRMLAAIIAGANLVIGPDSCALHFAAAFELPALGFWGPFSPAARSDYYPRQIHIFHSEKCPNAPCFNVLPNLPVHKCPQGAKQQSCEVFAGITPDEISAAIKELTR